jgi:hypothetical protein
MGGTPTVRQIIFILTAVITLSLISSLPIAAAVNMPPEGPLIFPPTTTEGQKKAKEDLAKLIGPELKETTDSNGNIMLSITTYIGDEPISISSKIGEGSRKKVSEEFEKGFIVGYSLTLTKPKDALSTFKYITEDPNSETRYSEDVKAGFLAGVDAGLAAKDLVKDTIEALGIKKLPSKPPV